jgi:hypothetical protein
MGRESGKRFLALAEINRKLIKISFRALSNRYASKRYAVCIPYYKESYRMADPGTRSKRGFASMAPEKAWKIRRLGGQTVHWLGTEQT